MNKVTSRMRYIGDIKGEVNLIEKEDLIGEIIDS
jgi:hypothetical protein